MTPSVVITIVTVGAIAWLAFLGVSALRRRGSEEIPPNLSPGSTDDRLETRRLERVQQMAVLTTAFLAVSLPLYFLGEQDRQENLAAEYHGESVTQGEHLVEEFACFTCHGPGGSGGSATFVEKRSGVSTLWAAPSLNDIFYRYQPEEVNFWVTYGRPNTPMPAWGVAGGGSFIPQQVQAIVNYLETIQVTQAEALLKVNERTEDARTFLEDAEERVQEDINTQQQLIANLKRAPDLEPIAKKYAVQARGLLTNAKTGQDTDADGVSDAAEKGITDVVAQAIEELTLPGLVPVTLDPANSQSSGKPDAEAAEESVASIEALVDEAPILTSLAVEARTALTAAMEPGTTDTDGDGLSDEGEGAINGLLVRAAEAIAPRNPKPVTLDVTNAETVVGTPDEDTAAKAVADLETAATNLFVSTSNQDTLLASGERGLDFLLQAQRDKLWDIDIAGVARAAFSGDQAKAEHAVDLFLGYCARCHTAGFSAGAPFAKQAGSGAFGPALWNGRPLLQFGPAAERVESDPLIQFLIKGSEAQKAYGINGIGTGRMPQFGNILSLEDIKLIAQFLRGGNLNGKGPNA